MLGIDVGTGGTRALLVNESGALAGAATAEHVPFASPRTAWAEQDANDWWRACQVAVREVLERTGVSARQVACVGLSGQMHGAVLLDEKDTPLRPAIIWCDQRSADESAELARTPGNDAIIKLTCNPPLTNGSGRTTAGAGHGRRE